MLGLHLTLMAVPCVWIGSVSRSLFEEIGRKMKKKNRKFLWRAWYVFWGVPIIFTFWIASIYTWVDVYGIPAKKPCDIAFFNDTTDRRRRRAKAK